jgi:hypothetical protein
VANRLVQFYSGESPDHAGRFLRDIQRWPDDRLEAVHDFIQWLFPLPEPSPVNPSAPVLDTETVKAFAMSPELQDTLRISFRRMLNFYGLEQTQSGAVDPASNFSGRSSNWLHPGSHNHLRITRILKCLCLLGLRAESRAFFGRLEIVYRQQPDKITARSFRYWQDAIG